MGVNYNPKIVTSDLSLYLDAANPKSYVSPEAFFYNLTDRNAKSFKLSGANTYITANGSILFNAITGTAASQSTLTLTTQNTITVSAWVKVYAHGNWNDFMGNNWTNNGWALFASSTDWVFGIAQSSTQYVSYGNHNSSNSWTHLAGTYDGSTVKLYVNGVLQSATASYSNAGLDVNKTIRLSGANDPGDKEIAMVSVYNRALSQDEVLQNFNAIRGRFGI